MDYYEKKIIKHFQVIKIKTCVNTYEFRYNSSKYHLTIQT